MADKGMLARLLAGLIGPGASAPPNFAPPAYAQPFTGLRNEPATPLPAFEAPGQELAKYQPPIPTASPQGNYGPAWGAPAPAPMPQPAPGPAPWMDLGNQARTAAFDPTRDFSDPRNVHAVDEFGQVVPRRGLMGPV